MTRIRAVAIPIIACLMATPPSAQEQPRAEATVSDAETPASALPWLRLEHLSATRDRPLFAPDRRPLQSAPPVTPAAPITIAEREPEAPRLIPPTLKGIIIEGSATLVLLEDQASAEQIVVRSGDRFGPWQVVAETDHSVRLAAGDERVVLDLRNPN